ncbi:TadE-like protein [Planctomycetes bacterium CA13]|uniref:TadE-like protein n=1 Tax=Novipirellula herctigrandis TaxID=2527986 RepID=A0A5C5Z1M1_9BACT|nr:TadE-like protein [Planctomycetes bacterium CA13]
MTVLLKPKRRRPKRRIRNAVAAVELAICLPVLILLTLGTLDVCSMLFLRETITIAAYEGARQGVGRGHTDADATDCVMEFLDQRNVQYDGSNLVTISTPGFTDAETLENVTVTVTVPVTENLLIPAYLFGDMTMSADVTMRKEYTNLSN